jgi:hypothetical protein
MCRPCLATAVTVSVSVTMMAPPASAQVTIGTTLDFGQALGREADERFGAEIYAHLPAWRDFTFGGALSGGIEGYTGGYGCQTQPSDTSVPAIGVVCLRPSLSLHGLAGLRRAVTETLLVHVDGGLGVTFVLLVPGRGGGTTSEGFPSARARAALLIKGGRGFGAQWFFGLRAQELVLGRESPRAAFSAGLLLEGFSLD